MMTKKSIWDSKITVVIPEARESFKRLRMSDELIT